VLLVALRPSSGIEEIDKVKDDLYSVAGLQWFNKDT
jgi:hypothetical protein